jgi:LAO/AO transport system kinase
MANILKVLEGLRSGPDATGPVFSASKHWDYILQSRDYNAHAGTFNNGYLRVGNWKYKAGASDPDGKIHVEVGSMVSAVVNSIDSATGQVRLSPVIIRTADASIVTLVPGAGDDVQALKAGILEIADIHVVSKCDRPDANRTITDLKSMLALAASLAEKPVWQVPVVATSSETGQGIGELVAAIDEHRSVHHGHPLGNERLRHIAEYRALKTAEDLLRSRFAASRGTRLAELVDRISRRELDPFAAAETLLNNAAI